MSKPSYEELEAQVKQLAAERDAVVAESAALKAGQLFFMYSDETGFEIHKTQDAAIASAKDMIAVCREEEAQDGWPEDADTICWGVIMQKAIEIDFEEPSEKNGWIGWSEYKLNPELKIPATDTFLASLRAEGVEMLAAHHQSIVDKLDGDSLFGDGTRQHSAIAAAATYFAAQLRSQSEQVKGVQS